MYEVTEPTQFPQFWNEEWLQVVIQELDKRAFTPEQRLSYEMTISANALAIKNERKKIQEAEDRKTKQVVANALDMGLTIEQSAKLAGVSIEFVTTFQRKVDE